MKTEVIHPRWSGVVIVAAPGPSLTPDVAELCKGQRVLAVGDAWRRIPWAEVLYHCDARWWDIHKGCPGFAGEKWASTDRGSVRNVAQAQRYGLRLIEGRHAPVKSSKEKSWFSLDASYIHYGRNSGFQGLNLAILFGANPVVLVGYDMQGTQHFFGRHPNGLRQDVNYGSFAVEFDYASTILPPDREILNATPNSKIQGFKRVALADVLVRQAA